MKQVQFQNPNGSPAASPAFGEVPPGTSSPLTALQLKNTGDVPLTTIKAWVSDPRYRVTLNGTVITATTEAAAQEVLSGALAAGDTLPMSEQWITPAGDTESAVSVIADLSLRIG